MMKLNRQSLDRPALLLFLVAMLVLVATQTAMAQPAEVELPKGKQTSLGLYMTAQQAWDKWQGDPENIKVLDVRTTEEYLFVGHAAMAWNIPLMSLSYEWDPGLQFFAMKPNPDFLAQVTEVAKPTDTILVMCRSGGRSAMAVNLLAQAGFQHVYNITDGMEGDEVSDPASVFQGQRLMNGWKNSGLPWTYEPDPERMRFAEPPAKGQG